MDLIAQYIFIFLIYIKYKKKVNLLIYKKYKKKYFIDLYKI